MTNYDFNDDIGYRVKNLDSASPWFGSYTSQLGMCGMAECIHDARLSASANGMKKGTYEIWKMHIGDINSRTPYFPPEKVV